MMETVALAKRLQTKADLGLAKRGLRGRKTEDIFTKRYLISPDDFLVANYPRKGPLAAFNPGAVLKDGRVYIFPRLIFDYYSYTSSIGVTELSVEELLSGGVERPLMTRIVLWPEKPWEAVKGCEDPRVFLSEEGFWVLYTGVGKHEEDEKEVYKSVLGFAELGADFSVRRKGFFSVVGSEGAFIPNNKDSALVGVQAQHASMLTRPSFPGLPDMCWRAEADLKDLVIPEETLEPVLVAEPWEYKVGWSTNTVKLSESEYLVGWHGVLREDLSYRNGLALVDREGKLLRVSDYLLAPKGLSEEYGDRSLAIFGDGLLQYGGSLIWVGGVSDYSVGVFIANVKEALSMLRGV